ncbi:TauD/TfdA family dioxygenase [Actinoplanes sp. NPDC049802]|uniref:TauD/TfdA family dioxygenase n=1 Tax=Actinoplanes sp. NPDC049802 TaxID=3154742 RepID=UPI0033D9F192
MTISAPSRPETGSDMRFVLTDLERDELRALAGRAARHQPGRLDDPQWLTEIRRLSCGLPVRLRETIRQYRHDPGPDGTLILANLPVHENELPETPAVRDSVERIAAVPSAATMLIGQQLGEIIAYRDEKFGALLQNVVPVPELAESQSNGGSVPLEFHTENAFHPNRPHYVGLMCLRGDHDGVAGTLVSSIRRVLPLLDPADVQVLLSPRFLTDPPPSFRAGGMTEPHPVLGGDPEDPNLRVDFNTTTALDEDGKAALERLRTVMTESATLLVLEPGELVLVDNRLVVHGRTLFTPRYDGRDRWLHRIFVHLDSRGSRVHRTANGSVLV